MRAVVTRVSRASVTIEGRVSAQVSRLEKNALKTMRKYLLGE